MQVLRHRARQLPVASAAANVVVAAVVASAVAVVTVVPARMPNNPVGI